MKEYPIYKKRDGQSWQYIGYIYSDSFKNAKKEFAENMTKDSWNKLNNVVWLTKETGGVQTGWYDLGQSIVVYAGDGSDKIDKKLSLLVIVVLDKDIKKGFSFWSEDVYQWELRKS